MRKMTILLTAVGVGLLLGGPNAVAERIESPDYEVLAENEGYEIRAYAPFIIAEVRVQGSYRSAMNQGFRKLADYIFGGNERNQSIKMTAPVFHREAPAPGEEAAGGTETHLVRFVMPSKWNMESLPKPNNDEVKLEQVPGGTYAVIRFSGWASAKSIENQRAELLEAMERDGLPAKGEPVAAQYNPPWTLPFLRRNEILVPTEYVPEMESAAQPA